MKKMCLNGKEIYIVRSHNQVLEAWNLYIKPNVFSIDFHTDTKIAFKNYAYWRAYSEVKNKKCSSLPKREISLRNEKITQFLEKKISLNHINDNLKHDEHIDFAVKTDIVNKVFILAKNSNITSSNSNVYLANRDKSYNNQAIIEYSYNFSTSDISDITKKKYSSDNSIEAYVLMDAIRKAEIIEKDFFDNYILDIDCDYFNSEESLKPKNIDVFIRLLKNAKCITIALEPECVKICRLKDSKLTSDVILDNLIKIIKSAL